MERFEVIGRGVWTYQAESCRLEYTDPEYQLNGLNGQAVSFDKLLLVSFTNRAQ